MICESLFLDKDVNSRLLSQITAQSITTAIQRLKTQLQIPGHLLLSSAQLLWQAAAGCSQLGELSCESSSLCPLVPYWFLSFWVAGPVPQYLPSAAVGLLKAPYEVRMGSLEVLHAKNVKISQLWPHGTSLLPFDSLSAGIAGLGAHQRICAAGTRIWPMGFNLVALRVKS